MTRTLDIDLDASMQTRVVIPLTPEFRISNRRQRRKQRGILDFGFSIGGGAAGAEFWAGAFPSPLGRGGIPASLL